MLTKIIRTLLLIIVIAFFSYTLINKALDMNAFLLNIAKTGIFHDTMVDIIGYGAITAEALAILLLIFVESKGIIWSLLMMFSFTIYIIILYLTGHYEVCGCGGILNGLSFPWHLLINCLILFSLFILALLHEKDTINS